MNLAIELAAESDNLISMKEMTATEVARNFSAVIDAVEGGEEIVIVRGKVAVARIVPTEPHVPNGKALGEWFAKRAAAGELLGKYPEWVEAMDELMADRERQREEMKTKWDDVY